MKKSTLFFLAFFMSSSFLFGQTEKLKTVFIYNFTKYIQWPPDAMSESFVIGVMGSSGLTKELEALASMKKVGDLPIVVKQLSSVTKEDNLCILILTEEASSQLEEARSAIAGKPTLIVADKEGSASRGAGINFLIESGKLLFEINRTNIEEHSLKVSSQLLSLGKQVQ